MATERELLAVVRAQLETPAFLRAAVEPSAALAALHELEARADERERGVEDVFVWPILVKEAAEGILGKLGSRDYRTLDRRIRHAYQCWRDKYGELNPEQADYAVQLLSSCFDVRGEGNPRPLIYTRLDRVVHHEKVHAGFLKRAPSGNEGVVADLVSRVAS